MKKTLLITFIFLSFIGCSQDAKMLLFANNINLETDLYFVWELDAVSSNTSQDASSNNNDATLSGIYSVVSGKLSNCVRISSSSTQITAPTNETDLSEYTISIWVNIDAPLILNNIWGIGGNNESLTASGATPTYPDDNYLRVYYYNGSSNSWDLGADYLVPDDTWTHIVLTRTSTGMKVYVDGFSNSSLSGSLSALPNTNFSIGAYLSATGITGDYDQCAMWTRALNSSEVIYLYNSGNGRTYTNW
jgi:hypothetical protein